MRSATISKEGRLHRPPNVADIEAFRAGFTWEEARTGLAGLPGGRGVNIAHEAVDRHAGGPRAGTVALRWLGKEGASRDLTYRDLARATSRFANVLRRLGLGPGDPVFVLTGRIPELHVAVLGALKHRCVVTPLFAAFGPEPLRTRLELGEARVLVTTPSLYQRKVASIRPALPRLAHVLLVSEAGAPRDLPGAVDLERLMEQAEPAYEIGPTPAETPALVHFTSGTTGRPKGAVHVHDAVLAHYVTGKVALDLQAGDVFWCTADPGWVTGTSYGIIAPLTHGVTCVVDEAEFDAERWYRILGEQSVTVWYTAPTAVRMMMKAGADLARRHAFPALRFIASV
ncbi:MAG: AMP-binding protein, partial [Deltaproteobacteria bacterium]